MHSETYSQNIAARYLEDCVAIVREAVLGRRGLTCHATPQALEQAALDLGLPITRAKKLFYREIEYVRREFWLALKQAAIRDCTKRAYLLQDKLEAAHARRRQHELELEAACGFSAGRGCGSANGERDAA
jgi:hypothetical protein